VRRSKATHTALWPSEGGSLSTKKPSSARYDCGGQDSLLMGSVPAGAAAADSPTRQSALRGCDAAYTPTWSSAERIVAHLVTPPAHFWASPTSVHLRFTSVALTSRPSPLGPSPPAWGWPDFRESCFEICGGWAKAQNFPKVASLGGEWRCRSESGPLRYAGEVKKSLESDLSREWRKNRSNTALSLPPAQETNKQIRF
jgi:hypothetical protein